MSRGIFIIDAYQIFKDVSLMYVDGNECLKFGSLHLGEVKGRLTDECVEQGEEGLVRLLHDLLVILGMSQCLSGVPGPDHLYT